MPTKTAKPEVNLYDDMQGSLDAAKRAASGFYYQPKIGANTIRIMPELENDNPKWYREVTTHWLNKKPFNCPNYDPAQKKSDYVDGRCFLCETRQQLYNTGTEESAEMAKKISARRSWFVNVVDKGEKEPRIKTWRFGLSVWQQLVPICSPTEDGYGDITDLDDGYYLKLAYEKDPKISYTLTPVRLSSKFEFDEVFEADNIPSLNEAAASASNSEMVAAWEGMIGEDEETNFEETEIVVTSKPSVLKARKVEVEEEEEEDDDTPKVEVEEEEEEEVAPTASIRLGRLGAKSSNGVSATNSKRLGRSLRN